MKKGIEIDFLTIGTESKGGDAIIIRFGDLLSTPINQQIIIIDGGYELDGDRIIDIVRKKYNTNTIDLVVLTHPDQDHASGLRTLFKDEKLIIKKLVMHRPWANDKINTSYFKDGRKTDKSLNDDLQEAFKFAADLEELAIEKIGESNISEPRLGTSYLNGCLTILGPSTELYKSCLINSSKTPEGKDKYLIETPKRTFSAIPSYEEFQSWKLVPWDDSETTDWINETSIISLIQFDEYKILLTGDAGKKGLNEAFDYAASKGIDLNNFKIVQVPHHGSRKNINPDLVDRFSCDYCIISSPPKGDPIHPSRRLINLLIQKGKDVYTTTGFTSLHWGENHPERYLQPAVKKTLYTQIEK